MKMAVFSDAVWAGLGKHNPVRTDLYENPATRTLQTRPRLISFAALAGKLVA